MKTERLNQLSILAEDDPAQPVHARAFTYWIKNKDIEKDSAFELLVMEASEASGASLLTNHIAVLGYAVDLERKHTKRFSEGLAWLRERQYFVSGRPRTFEADGLALLGVAVGIKVLPIEEADSARKWIQDLLRKSVAENERMEDWNSSLISSAAMIMQLPSNSKPLPDLIIALSTKNLLNSTKEDRTEAWSIANDLQTLQDGMTRAAAQIAAINYIMRDIPSIRFDQTSIEDAQRVLNGLVRSLRHWTWEEVARTQNSSIARWDVENEYHVQNFLWAVLSPIFPDLDDEEWLKSLGHHHPRADLAIPSLRLIVEAKFLRQGKRAFAKVTEEVAADASTYLRDKSGYDYLIVVVWDDMSRTEQHHELKQGLMEIRGVTDVVILSRPSTMVRLEKKNDKNETSGDEDE